MSSPDCALALQMSSLVWFLDP